MADTQLGAAAQAKIGFTYDSAGMKTFVRDAGLAATVQGRLGAAAVTLAEQVAATNKAFDGLDQAIARANKNANTYEKAQQKLSLAQADAGGKVAIYTNQLAKLEAGSLHYLQVQEKLVRAEQVLASQQAKAIQLAEKAAAAQAKAQAKAANQASAATAKTTKQNIAADVTAANKAYDALSAALQKAKKNADAYEQAQHKVTLAQLDSAGKVDFYKNQLAKLDSTSIEYLRTQEKLIGAQKTLDQEMAAAKGGGIGGFLKGTGGQVLGALGIATSISSAITGIKALASESLELANRANSIGDAFEKSTARAGVGGEALIAKLRAVSNGTITTANLQLAANKSLSLEVTSDGQKMADLLVLAKAKGREFGVTATSAFEDMVTGIGRLSPRILDNLGLMIDDERAYSLYARTVGKTVDTLTDQEKKTALVNDLIASNRDLINQTRVAGADATDQLAKSQADLEEAKTTFGKTILPLQIKVTTVGSAVAGALADLFSGANSPEAQAEQANKQLIAQSTTYEDYQKRVAAITAKLRADADLDTTSFFDAIALRDSADALEGLAAATSPAVLATQQLSTATDHLREEHEEGRRSTEAYLAAQDQLDQATRGSVLTNAQKATAAYDALAAAAKVVAANTKLLADEIIADGERLQDAADKRDADLATLETGHATRVRTIQTDIAKTVRDGVAERGKIEADGAKKLADALDAIDLRDDRAGEDQQVQDARKTADTLRTDGRKAAADQLSDDRAATTLRISDARAADAVLLAAARTAAADKLAAARTAAADQRAADRTAAADRLADARTAAADQLAADRTAEDRQVSEQRDTLHRQISEARSNRQFQQSEAAALADYQELRGKLLADQAARNIKQAEDEARDLATAQREGQLSQLRSTADFLEKFAGLTRGRRNKKDRDAGRAAQLAAQAEAAELAKTDPQAAAALLAERQRQIIANLERKREEAGLRRDARRSGRVGNVDQEIAERNAAQQQADQLAIEAIKAGAAEKAAQRDRDKADQATSDQQAIADLDKNYIEQRAAARAARALAAKEAAEDRAVAAKEEEEDLKRAEARRAEDRKLQQAQADEDRELQRTQTEEDRALQQAQADEDRELQRKQADEDRELQRTQTNEDRQRATDERQEDRDLQARERQEDRDLEAARTAEDRARQLSRQTEDDQARLDAIQQATTDQLALFDDAQATKLFKLDKALRDERDAYDTSAAAILKTYQDLADGVQARLQKLRDDLNLTPDEKKIRDSAEAMRQIGDTLGSAFAASLQAAIDGVAYPGVPGSANVPGSLRPGGSGNGSIGGGHSVVGNAADRVISDAAIDQIVLGGKQTDGFNSPRGGDLHAGVDFATPSGTPVTSPTDGVISGIGTTPAGGNYVKVAAPNGDVWYFGHLTRPSLPLGAAVRRGQQVAVSGATGTAVTGPHVHVQLQTRANNGRAVDPTAALESLAPRSPAASAAAAAGGGGAAQSGGRVQAASVEQPEAYLVPGVGVVPIRPGTMPVGRRSPIGGSGSTMPVGASIPIPTNRTAQPSTAPTTTIIDEHLEIHNPIFGPGTDRASILQMIETVYTEKQAARRAAAASEINTLRTGRRKAGG